MKTDIQRQKATPLTHPGVGPATIPAAYDELSQEAFAAWIRLMVAGEAELSAGRASFARMLGYKERRSNEVLRELHLKGYISFNVTPGKHTRVVIDRRALISARANFVRLSNIVSTKVERNEVEAVGGVVFMHFPRPTFETGVGLTWQRVGLTWVESWTYLGGESYLPGLRAPRTIKSGEVVTQQESSCTVLQSLFAATKFSSTDAEDRCKFVDETAYKEGSEPVPKRDLIDRMREGKDRIKEAKHVERSETAARRINAAKVKGRVPGSIDWIALDKYDDPVLTFDPNSSKHHLFIAILDKPKNDRARVALVSKITTEFCRIYTRYRREAERRRRSYSDYNVPDEERRYAAEAGTMCLRKGVTPRQLLEYWDGHIQNFADRTMVLPPLSFLKSPANIDRVACSTFAAPAAPAGAYKPAYARPAETTPKPVGGNSYANLKGLDPRLRPSLEKGGYKTQAYNDRYLLTIQHNAILIASGKSVFLAEGKLKDMSAHAAQDIYAQ